VTTISNREVATRAVGYILIVGPDGAGKTTVADALVREASAGGTEVTRAHWRPAVVFGGKGSGEVVTEPHAKRPRGDVASFLKTLVVFLDFGVGWIGRWGWARRHGMLVVERGWFDQRVDPRRYRMSRRVVPLISALGACLPRADLTVMLVGDPSQVAGRKPELAVDEVARQQAVWREIARRTGRVVVEIDAVNSSCDAAVEGVRRAIDAALTERSLRWRRAPLAPRRLDLRVAGGRAAGPALGIYRPSKPLARTAAGLNRRLVAVSVAPRVEPPVVGVGDLTRRINVEADGMATMRSREHGRWVLGLANRSHLRAVVKLGPRDDRTLRREAATLERLRGVDRPVRVPTLRWAGEWRDWYVVATDALPRLHSARRITVDDAADIAVALARGIGEIGPVVHGDFASWNLLATGSGLALLDWEWSKDGFDPLVDLAHFVIQEGALLHRYAPEQAKRLLTDRDSPGWRYCEQVGISPRSAPSLVRNLLEGRRDPSEFTRELRGLLQ
jgi:hypothetical protein